MTKTIYILFLLLMIQSCSLSFLDDNENDETSDCSSYSVYDNQTDTKFSYDGDDNLQWYETYDFNDDGQCIFIKHYSSTGTVLWSYLYDWYNGEVKTEAYYNGDNELSWYNEYSYNSGNLVLQSYYESINGNNELTSFLSYEYSSTSQNTQTSMFDENESLEWAYKYSYDSNNRLSLSTAYNSSEIRTAYIENEYDSSDRITEKTGYGATQNSDTFDTSLTGFDFPEYGEVNRENRNNDQLTIPTAPADPEVPLLNLTDTTALAYEWMDLTIYTTAGYSFVSLNNNYMPVYIKTEAPEYLNDKPIEIELSYDGTRVDSKTTTYDNQEILKLEFDYDSSGYLSSLDTTGTSLLIPLRYEFTYDANNIPESISIYNDTTMLQKFVYEYSGDTSSINLNDFAKSINKIHHYDGDNTQIGYYEFYYDNVDNELSITVKNPDDTSNGSFLLAYDTDGNTASFASFKADGSQIWKYEYGYKEFNGNFERLSETCLGELNKPEVSSSFDIEMLFDDLRQYLPIP